MSADTLTEYRAIGSSPAEWDPYGYLICGPEEAAGPWRSTRMGAVSDCRWLQEFPYVEIETREVVADVR